MKNFLAVLLALSIIFTLGIPAFAAEKEPETSLITEEEILDIVTSDEFKEALEKEGYDIEEFEEKIESGDYEIVEDSEVPLTYNDRITFVMELGGELFSLSLGAILMSCTMGLVFPGLIVLTVPTGIMLFVAGIGTIVVSPILALLFSEDYIRENSFRV